jgi:hypothetical protein
LSSSLVSTAFLQILFLGERVTTGVKALSPFMESIKTVSLFMESFKGAFNTLAGGLGSLRRSFMICPTVNMTPKWVKKGIAISIANQNNKGSVIPNISSPENEANLK